MADKRKAKKIQFFLSEEDEKRLLEFEKKQGPAFKKMGLRSKIFSAGMNQVIKQRGTNAQL